MNAGAIVIFLLAYSLISFRRLRWVGLDRPAGALLGATLMVAWGALSPAEAMAAVDGNTLLLLFGVMGMGAFLQDGSLDAVEARLARWVNTPRAALGAVVWGAGLLSALITNDAACILLAPGLVRLIRRFELPALPLLLALATGANTGSVATLVGNPQNMLCGLLGGLDYGSHLLAVGPLALVCLAVNHLWLRWLFRRELDDRQLSAADAPQPMRRTDLMAPGVIALTAVAYSLGLSLPWTAAAGFVLLLLLKRGDSGRVWARIDFALLVFFASLFVLVAGLAASGLPQWLFTRWPLPSGGGGLADTLNLAAVFLVGSNVVSNVPFILIVEDQMMQLSDPTLGWRLLAVASTFAGNLTLLGSVANIIVAEAGRDVGGLGFGEHLKAGAPLALATTALGALWLAWLSG